MYGQPMMMQQPMMQQPMMQQPMMQQPMMYPPPPPPQQGPMIINLSGNNGRQDGSGTNCPVCSHETGNIPNKKAGMVTFIWCLALLFCTGVCCWIPFCTDGCKDTQLVCVKCQTIKATIPASCF